MAGFERTPAPETQERPLSPAELILAGEAVVESVQALQATYLKERSLQVEEFIASVVTQYAPYQMVNPEGFGKVIELVFTQDVVRDFVFTLHFQIGARIAGLVPHVFDSLAANLAQGLAPMRESTYSGVPQAVADRLVSSQEAYNLLVANPWLVIVLLLQMFIRIELQKV